MSTTAAPASTRTQTSFRTQIFETDDYSKFSTIVENREYHINRKHIKTIAASIEKHGFLPEKPLLVKDMGSTYVIIDGQHRLEAAKLMSSKVYYQFTDLDAEDVTDLQIAKSWNSKDYIHYYSKRGVQSYQVLERLCANYPTIGISTFIALFRGGSRPPGSMKEFRDGLLEIKYYEKAKRTIQLVSEIVEKYPDKHFLYNREFLIAMLLVTTTKDYNHKHFMDKLLTRNEAFYQSLTMEKYLHMITDIYNWKTRGEKIDFTTLRIVK